MERFDYFEAFSRNIGLLTQAEQERLRGATVAIPGLGGVGGIYVLGLARLGIGRFRIADNDVYELVNTNRQFIATQETIGKSKAEASRDALLSINPEADVRVFPSGITEENIDEFLDGVDVVCDGIDFFSFETRRMLFKRAYEKGIFVVTAAPIGFGSSVLVFDPKGMSFDRYFDIHNTLTETEKLIRFGIGLTPALLQRSYFDPDQVSWKEQKGPSSATGVLLCAGIMTGLVARILLGKPIQVAPHSLHFDIFAGKMKKSWLPFGNRGPIQILKRYIMTWMLRRKGKID